MQVHERYPYAGELVHTSFSGSHQDAINKGLKALERDAAEQGVPLPEFGWDVPYLPVDPKDIGRSYRAIIRVNSQSGKGGVDYLLGSLYGLRLPRGLQAEVSSLVQALSDGENREVSAEELWAVFAGELLPEAPRVALLRYETSAGSLGVTALKAEIAVDGESRTVSGSGVDVPAAFADALGGDGLPVKVLEHSRQCVTLDGAEGTLAYARCAVGGQPNWGCGFAPDAEAASLRAVCTALHRSGAAAAS